jgi:ribosomal protein L29
VANGHEPAKGEPAKSKRTYTRSEIAAMSPEEYAKNAEDLKRAMADGRVKQA